MFITFLSDFGLKDDFVGTCHGVMKRIAPDAQIIDITHGIPAAGGPAGRARARQHDRVHAGRRPSRGRRSRVSAGPRRPLALRDDEGRLYVGPGQRAAAPAASRAGIAAAHELANPEYALESISRTFHGRDLFSPAAAHLATGVAARGARPAARSGGRSSASTSRAGLADGAVVATLLYVDSFGNIALNLTREDVERLGIVSGTRVELELAGERYYAVMAQDVRRRAAGRRDPLRGQLQEHVGRDLARERGADAARLARAADPDHARAV